MDSKSILLKNSKGDSRPGDRNLLAQQLNGKNYHRNKALSMVSPGPKAINTP
jgi:hypothetical protein